MQEKVGN